MPGNAFFDTSITWGSSLLPDIPAIQTSVTVFEERVRQWAERELSMGANGADIHKATHALLHGGSVIDLAGLHLTSLPDAELPPDVLRLDLSNNPQLTTIPARFLSQTPFIYVVIDNTALSSETIRFFEDSLGCLLFHREQQPTDAAEPEAYCLFPEQFFTDVQELPFDRYTSLVLPDESHSPSGMKQPLPAPEQQTGLEHRRDNSPEGKESVKAQPSMLSDENRRWLERNFSFSMASSTDRVRTLSALCLAYKPWPAELTLDQIARYYGVQLPHSLRANHQPRAEPAPHPISAVNREWLDRYWRNHVPEGEDKVEAVATLYLKSPSLPMGLIIPQIAEHFTLMPDSLRMAIARVKDKVVHNPVSDQHRAWLEQNWSPKLAGVKRGRTAALAALCVASKPPAGLTQMQIARYYHVKYNGLTTAIYRWHQWIRTETGVE
jgi:hypothetical protein